MKTITALVLALSAHVALAQQGKVEITRADVDVAAGTLFVQGQGFGDAARDRRHRQVRPGRAEPLADRPRRGAAAGNPVGHVPARGRARAGERQRLDGRDHRCRGNAGAGGPVGPAGPIGPQGARGSGGRDGTSGTARRARAPGADWTAGNDGAGGAARLHRADGPAGPQGEPGPAGRSDRWVRQVRGRERRPRMAGPLATSAP